MGIQIDSALMVGCHATDLNVPDKFNGDIWEYFESLDLDYISPYYDSGDDCYFGYYVDDFVEYKDFDDWVVITKELMKNFEESMGVEAKLICSQHVT